MPLTYKLPIVFLRSVTLPLSFSLSVSANTLAFTFASVSTSVSTFSYACPELFLPATFSNLYNCYTVRQFVDLPWPGLKQVCRQVAQPALVLDCPKVALNCLLCLDKCIGY